MFRDAGRALGELLATGHALFHREADIAAAAGKAGARPDEGPPLDPQTLADALLAVRSGSCRRHRRRPRSWRARSRSTSARR